MNPDQIEHFTQEYRALEARLDSMTLQAESLLSLSLEGEEKGSFLRDSRYLALLDLRERGEILVDQQYQASWVLHHSGNSIPGDRYETIHTLRHLSLSDEANPTEEELRQIPSLLRRLEEREQALVDAAEKQFLHREGVDPRYSLFRQALEEVRERQHTYRDLYAAWTGEGVEGDSSVATRDPSRGRRKF